MPETGGHALRRSTKRQKEWLRPSVVEADYGSIAGRQLIVLQKPLNLCMLQYRLPLNYERFGTLYTETAYTLLAEHPAHHSESIGKEGEQIT